METNPAMLTNHLSEEKKEKRVFMCSVCQFWGVNSPTRVDFKLLKI